MRRLTKRVSVLVVDSESLERTALGAALERTKDLRLVGTAPDQDGAVGVVRSLAPDVAVIVYSDADSSRAVLSEVKAARPEVAAVIVGGPEDVELLLDFVGRGAEGYLSDDASIDNIVTAVTAVAAGQQVYPPAVLNSLLHHLAEREQQRDAFLDQMRQLAPQQRRVLRLLVGGSDTKRIAQDLGITPRTVKGHLAAIFAKTGVHSRVELLSWWHRQARRHDDAEMWQED